MKKLTGIFIIFCMTLYLAACNSSEYEPQKHISFNYNNLSTANSDFWLTNDAVYYHDAENYAYYRTTKDGTTKIASTVGNGYTKIHEYNNKVYMVDWLRADREWPNDAYYSLHAYDIETQHHTVLTELKNIDKHFIVDDIFYYLQGDVTSADAPFFRAYSLKDGSDTIVAQNVLAIGVSNEKPVYATYQDTTFSIYSLESGTATLIGNFTYESKDGFRADCNFTDDQFIIATASSSPKLICYRFGEENAKEYAIDTDPETVYPTYEIYTATAYEDYAYLVVVENPNHEPEKYMIYRISLDTGEYEIITELDADEYADKETFVGSDDCVYVRLSTDPGKIYRYDANGEKTLICTIG